MAGNFVNLQFSKVVFGTFLGVVGFTFLNMYRPRYSTFYCFSNVKRLWLSIKSNLFYLS